MRTDHFLSPWSSWSACSQPCDGGSQTRSRTCDLDQAFFNLAELTEPLSQSQSCNEDKCGLTHFVKNLEGQVITEKILIVKIIKCFEKNAQINSWRSTDGGLYEFKICLYENVSTKRLTGDYLSDGAGMLWDQNDVTDLNRQDISKLQ